MHVYDQSLFMGQLLSTDLELEYEKVPERWGCDCCRLASRAALAASRAAVCNTQEHTLINYLYTRKIKSKAVC